MADQTASQYAPSEMQVLEGNEIPEIQMGFPPYPPYVTEPAPPSIADTIIAGRNLRVQHKSLTKKSVCQPPKPAKPKGPKATGLKMSKRAARAHARCLRRHRAVLSDRLEYISKPLHRSIVHLWREYAHTLPAETIARLRAMLDADEPFKPDQAFEHFSNIRKIKKKAIKMRTLKQIKKDILDVCADKRFGWARNATVIFARAIKQRLARPGTYTLADGMLRLSNIVLDDICGYMNVRTPSRYCKQPKAKFIMEMADKVAVWIDDVLAESENRSLIMDFDDDDEVERSFVDGKTSVDALKNTTESGGPTPAITPISSTGTTPKASKTSVPKE